MLARREDEEERESACKKRREIKILLLERERGGPELRNEGRRRDGPREGGVEADREQDQPAGDVRQAPERAAQEGVRALRALRRRGRPHHLLQPRPPLRVLHLLMVRTPPTSALPPLASSSMVPCAPPPPIDL